MTLSGEIRLDLQRHTSTFLCLVAVLGPAIARGQSQAPSIDLSEPRKAEPPLPPPPQGTRQVQREGVPPGPAAAREPAAVAAPNEGDVALNDRVKAVQRKGFLKRHRLELGLAAPATINDAFYEKVGASAKVAYHLGDSFALQLRGTLYSALRSSHAKEGKQAFGEGSQLLVSQLDRQLTLDGVWSPIYGKVAWFGSRIVHFDVYFLAGAGAVWTATSKEPRNEGPHPAADLGAGLRFYPTDWLALEGGVVGTFYPDQPNSGVPSTLQKVISAQLGVSVFFPFHFGYVYP